MRCPSCGSSAVIYDEMRGEHICTRCGLVVMERSLVLEPSRATRKNDGSSHVDINSGIDFTQHDLGVGSDFGKAVDLCPSWRARLRQLKLWQKRARVKNSGEKNLREVLVQLDFLCEDLSLPKDIKEGVSRLYRKARARHLTTGRGTPQVLAALVFIMCRINGIPRTEEEFVKVLWERWGIREKSAVHAIRKLSKLFAGEFGIKLSRTWPEDYLGRFASKLNLPREATTHAYQICSTLPANLKQTKSPILLAAATLYVAAETGETRAPMRVFAEYTGVGISSLCQTAAAVRKFTSSVLGSDISSFG
jgi:transcription initiation factor TFIIB